MERGGQAEVHYPGWDAHFRIENWDDSHDVKYRVCHGEKAKFEGLIRKDPKDQDEIVVANLCNSSRTTGPRQEIVENIRHHNPDLLSLGGDQHYRHTENTTGWIEFGMQNVTSSGTARRSASQTTMMWVTGTCGARAASGLLSPAMRMADKSFR